MVMIILRAHRVTSIESYISVIIVFLLPIMQIAIIANVLVGATNALKKPVISQHR
ncbi:MAG: hypothetical protein WCF90_10400 [Methanomicrobiales archaeon]